MPVQSDLSKLTGDQLANMLDNAYRQLMVIEDDIAKLHAEVMKRNAIPKSSTAAATATATTAK